jgi:hypothetical protein
MGWQGRYRGTGRRRTLIAQAKGKAVKHKAKSRTFSLLCVLLLVVLALAGCSRTPPEERLRATIDSLQRAVEQHDGSTLQKTIAEDFIGPDGLDRNGARRMAQVMFLRYRDVGVSLGPLDIELRDQHATVRFTAALTGGAGVLPESGQLYDVETGWRLEAGEWRLVNADWKSRLQ